jgi:hypothetical protein
MLWYASLMENYNSRLVIRERRVLVERFTLVTFALSLVVRQGQGRELLD